MPTKVLPQKPDSLRVVVVAEREGVGECPSQKGETRGEVDTDSPSSTVGRPTSSSSIVTSVFPPGTAILTVAGPGGSSRVRRGVSAGTSPSSRSPRDTPLSYESPSGRYSPGLETLVLHPPPFFSPSSSWGRVRGAGIEIK